MGQNNNVTDVILLGLTQDPAGQKVLFVMFLLIYIVKIVGNLLIVGTVIASPSLNSPMYFFLACLSFLDIVYSTSISPKLIMDLLCDEKSISFTACMSQLFIEHLFGGTEIVILVAMAYDRYVAISNPLLYTVAMGPRKCWSLVVGAYVCGMCGAILRTTCTFSLSFCENNQINFFFCDLPPLLKLACSDTTNIEIIIVFFGNFVISANALVILISYLLIIKAVMRMKSSGRRAKTFSTCVSHLTAVALFLGPSPSCI